MLLRMKGLLQNIQKREKKFAFVTKATSVLMPEIFRTQGIS